MFACFGLTGCVLPPVLSYASMALDGASYLATGKSISDHALSAAVKQDCAVWRVVSEQDVDAVCQEYAEDAAGDSIAVALEAGNGAVAPPAVRPPILKTQPAEIVLASAAPVEPAAELAIKATPEPVDLLLGIDPAKLPADPDSNPVSGIDPAKLPADPDSNPVSGIEPAATDSAPGATNRKAIYLVIGSFRSVDHAERLAAQMSGITTAIAPALVGDDRYYRVVVGPYEPGETGDAQSRLAAAGIGNTWAASLCTGDLGAPPCDSSP